MLQPALPLLDGALVLGPLFVRIDLPGVPGFKARHRSRIVFPRDKSKMPFIQEYPDGDTEAYEKALAQMARVMMRSRAPTERPVQLLVRALKPIPKSWTDREHSDALAGAILPTSKPDWDNYGKIADALKGIVWKDDSQVVDGFVIKRYAPAPAMVLEVHEYVPP